jgi:predicted DNA-binding ribbon-helix-helix protein
MKQERRFVRSRVRRRTVRIGKHKTSLTVEEEFWQALKEIAPVQQLPVKQPFR